jgi:hypothetical protein
MIPQVKSVRVENCWDVKHILFLGPLHVRRGDSSNRVRKELKGESDAYFLFGR